MTHRERHFLSVLLMKASPHTANRISSSHRNQEETETQHTVSAGIPILIFFCKRDLNEC